MHILEFIQCLWHFCFLLFFVNSSAFGNVSLSFYNFSVIPIYVAIINGLFGFQKARTANIEVLHFIHVLFT